MMAAATLPDRCRVGPWLCLLLAITMLGVATVSAPATATEPTANVTVYSTRGGVPDSTTAVRQGIENGSIVPAEEAHLDQHLVVVIESSRLAESMANRSGSTTDRFLAELDGSATFRIVQTNPTPMQNRKITSIGARNATAYRDGNETYVLIDLDALEFRYRTTNLSADIFGSERFAIEFGYDLPELPLGGPYGPPTPVVGLHPNLGEFHTAGYWYEPLPPEWVEFPVQVEIAPEHALEVRVLADGYPTRAVAVDVSDPPEVRRVWVDLRGYEPGTEYVLELVHDGRVIDRYNGTIREPRANLSNVSVVDVGNQSAVTMTARLSHGGKVQVLNEACEVIGTEWVEPAVTRTVRIELWTRDGPPLRIENRSDAGLYVRSHRHLGASQTLYHRASGTARLGFEGACAAPEAPATPTVRRPTTPTTRTPTLHTHTHTPRTVDTTVRGPGTASGTQSTSVDSPGQPGFSVLTGVLAISAIALLGRRVGIER